MRKETTNPTGRDDGRIWLQEGLHQAGGLRFACLNPAWLPLRLRIYLPPPCRLCTQ